MRVAVATMFSPAYMEIAGVTMPNMNAYCQRHGYDPISILVDDEKWAYEKHRHFKMMFEDGYDLIWYKDVDAIITNMSTPVVHFIERNRALDNVHFFLTRDFNELNGGSVIIRNTPIGGILNDYVLDQKGVLDNEQNVYNSPEFMSDFYGKWTTLPHPSINSYRYGLYKECWDFVGREDLGDWVEGKSFVLHTPGLSLEKRLEILKSTKITQ